MHTERHGTSFLSGPKREMNFGRFLVSPDFRVFVDFPRFPVFPFSTEFSFPLVFPFPTEFSFPLVFSNRLESDNALLLYNNSWFFPTNVQGYLLPWRFTKKIKCPKCCKNYSLGENSMITTKTASSCSLRLLWGLWT